MQWIIARKPLEYIVCAISLLAVTPVFATSSCTQQQPCLSPLGHWLTIDDKTNKPRGVVNIYEKKDANGQVTLSGVVKFAFYIPGYPWNKVYRGSYEPFNGKAYGTFPVMWGYVSSGHGKWSHGKVFDSDHSKLYNSYIQLLDNGNQLKVSGCVMIVCRGQLWQRLDQAQYDHYYQQSQDELKAHPMTDN